MKDKIKKILYRMIASVIVLDFLFLVIFINSFYFEFYARVMLICIAFLLVLGDFDAIVDAFKGGNNYQK